MKPKKSVQEMKPYNPPLEGRRDFVRLDFNENTIGPSYKVIEAIRNVALNELGAYPEYSPFKKKLAKYLKVRYEEVAITNASDEAIKLVIDTFMENGDEIIIPVPTFPMFRFYAEVAGVKVREILYNKDLSFPTSKVIDALNEKTKIVVIVNPNSPTGTLVDERDIIKIIKKAKNSIVLLDEAYYQFSGKSMKKLVRKYDNLVILQTFSKAFGLAGLRLGYIISNKENIKSLTKANSPYSVNSLAVKAAMAAIEDSRYVKKYVSMVQESRKLLKKFLQDFGIRFFDSRANFILVDFGNKAKKIEKELKKKGILVRSQSDKPLLKGCVRITLGAKSQTLKLIKSLVEVLK